MSLTGLRRYRLSVASEPHARSARPSRVLVWLLARTWINENLHELVHSTTDMFGELVSFLFSLQSFLLVIILIVTLYTISCLLFPDVPVSDLEKKAVLITGCDSGFGYELAKKLDSRGLQVFAGCLTSDGQAKLRSECSTRMTTLGLDVVNQSDIQKALEVVKSFLSSNGTNGACHNFHLPPFNRTKQLPTEL